MSSDVLGGGDGDGGRDGRDPLDRVLFALGDLQRGISDGPSFLTPALKEKLNPHLPADDENRKFAILGAIDNIISQSLQLLCSMPSGYVAANIVFEDQILVMFGDLKRRLNDDRETYTAVCNIVCDEILSPENLSFFAPLDGEVLIPMDDAFRQIGYCFDDLPEDPEDS